MALTALIALTTLGLNLPLQNPAAAASVTDALKLERTYKADEKNVYALKVGGAPSGDINLTITQKVTKLLDNGNAGSMPPKAARPSSRPTSRRRECLLSCM